MGSGFLTHGLPFLRDFRFDASRRRGRPSSITGRPRRWTPATSTRWPASAARQPSVRASDDRALRTAVRRARRGRRAGPGDDDHRLLAGPGEALGPGRLSWRAVPGPAGFAGALAIIAPATVSAPPCGTARAPRGAAPSTAALPARRRLTSVLLPTRLPCVTAPAFPGRGRLRETRRSPHPGMPGLRPVPPARCRTCTSPSAGASPWLARQSTGCQAATAIPELVDASAGGGP